MFASEHKKAIVFVSVRKKPAALSQTPRRADGRPARGAGGSASHR